MTEPGVGTVVFCGSWERCGTFRPMRSDCGRMRALINLHVFRARVSKVISKSSVGDKLKITVCFQNFSNPSTNSLGVKITRRMSFILYGGYDRYGRLGFMLHAIKL